MIPTKLNSSNCRQKKIPVSASNYLHIFSFLFFILLPLFSAYCADGDDTSFYGDISLEFAYDSNIEGVTNHSVGEEDGDKDEDFLTIISLNLGFIKSFDKKINLDLSYNEMEKFYVEKYEEDSNRHTGEAEIAVLLTPSLSLRINNRTMFHRQPKEDIHDFFANFAAATFTYDLNQNISLSAGYHNRLKKYTNREQWDFTRNSFFLQTRYSFSPVFWITGSYEGFLYRGKNNLFYEKEEQKELEKEGRHLYEGKTAKGNEHQLIFSVSRIFEKGSFIDLKYRFVSNSVNEVTNVLEERELGEFEGEFTYENDEQDFNYTLNEATLLYSQPLRENITLEIVTLYQFQNFDGDAFEEEEGRSRRLDRLAVADITLSIDITENLELRLRNAISVNESNYPEKEYERNYSSISLTYSF